MFFKITLKTLVFPKSREAQNVLARPLGVKLWSPHASYNFSRRPPYLIWMVIFAENARFFKIMLKILVFEKPEMFKMC